MSFLDLVYMLRPSRRFVEDPTDVPNPERGWYVGYNLLRGGDATRIRAQGRTLAGCFVTLPLLWPLPPSFLSQLDRGFEALRVAGVKTILRFRYTDTTGPDAPKIVMFKHIAELAPVLKKNADVIALIQMGMVGAYGELWGSTNGLSNDDDRSDILDAMLKAWPGYVCVRTPSQKRAYIERYGR